MKYLSDSELASVTGGMNWRDLPLSKNVEDRRPAWAKRRDDAWFRRQEQREHPAQNLPLPPRRPAGL